MLDPSYAPLIAPLTGPPPRLGRPPFLGPLIRKLAAARAAGLLAPGRWPPAGRRRLFSLLADHPPRDLGEGEIDLLRSLPIFERLAPPPAAAAVAGGGRGGGSEEGEGERWHDAGGGEGGEGSGGSSGGGSGGGDDVGDSGGGELVALGDRSDWLLVPARCLEQLGGEAAGGEGQALAHCCTASQLSSSACMWLPPSQRPAHSLTI